MGKAHDGLSSKEAETRLREYGPNELAEKKKENVLLRFISHFFEFLTLLLIAAAAVAFFLGEVVDAAMIFAIVIMQAIIGFVQEYRAEKAFEALRKMVSQKARVLRGGKVVEVDTRELVPGDVVILEAGDKVPADGLVLEGTALRVDEAALSGESVPVGKEPGRDRAYMGTIVVTGKGRMLIEGTGMHTKMGKITEMVQTVEKEQTPLERDMDKMAKQIGVAVIVLCALIFGAGVLKGIDVLEMFLTSVSLAVAAIPEGLAAVVVITLAIGVQRMSRRNAIVKKMKAVETLGCATVICTDKTGTLTKNEMTVRKVVLPQGVVDVSGSGYRPKGHFEMNGQKVEPFGQLRGLMRAGILCNDAYLREGKAGWSIIGDPTEGALVVLAAKGGFYKEHEEKTNPALMEFPFDSARKMMCTVRKEKGKHISYVKGAPEIVLQKCTSIMVDGKEKKIRMEDLLKMEMETNALTSNGYRTLAIAYREIDGKATQKNAENGLTLLGIVGMMDSPREEAKGALELCRQAGIRVIMITGDHPLTAKAIADELGIGNGKCISGEELDKMNPAEIDAAVREVSVYARVSPEHKLMLVDALNRRGEVVAMTGDGVNDAPALKKADIGVAMGITGTEVAKESGDLVLSDDNFATIVAAIEEGRGIYENIRKTVIYLVSSNIAEVAIIFCGVMFGLPLPLLAIQILWINLVTDGLPAIALAMDPVDHLVMRNKPREPGRSIWKGAWIVLAGYPIYVTAVTLAAFAYLVGQGDIVLAQTVAFTMLVGLEKVAAFSCRSLERVVWRDFFANRLLVYSSLLTLGIHIAILYVPALNGLFGVKPIGLEYWGWVAAASIVGLLYLEAHKWIHEKGFFAPKSA